MLGHFLNAENKAAILSSWHGETKLCILFCICPFLRGPTTSGLHFSIPEVGKILEQTLWHGRQNFPPW